MKAFTKLSPPNMNSAKLVIYSRSRRTREYSEDKCLDAAAAEWKVIAREKHALTTLSMLISQVIKDMTKSCDMPTCLEPINIFNHVWKYRGEGNANVVVALENEQRVIRLSKVHVGEPISDFSRHRRKVEREVIFANRVFGPLIGPEFVGSVKAIQLSQDQISRLNGMLYGDRPAHRRHKELRVPYATSHSDFARIHAYPSSSVDICVEIKPKQGWWPSSMRSCGGDLPNLCTYCLNQFLKLKRAKISSRTSYCPLDLFSGNPQRMIEAVTALIANPQNNFRVFCDGKLVYGETNDESLETVLNRWMGCAEKTASLHSAEAPSTLNSFVYLLCVALLKPTYIPDLSKCQQSNDTFNKITQQLRKILSHTPPSQLYEKIISKAPQPKDCGSSNNLASSSFGIDEKENFGKSCNDEAAPLPEGCILSRILEIQKLAERQKGAFPGESASIYKIYQKICPVHSCTWEKDVKTAAGRNRWSSSKIMSSNDSKLQSDDDDDDERTPRLNVILTGDELDNFVDSGTETERMSDSESFEEGFDTCSTEEEEEDTITGGLEGFESHNIPTKILPHSPIFSHRQVSYECPSASCLSSEKWLDEIDNLCWLSECERMATEMYLLAATAKDCSIMVTFSPINNNSCEEGLSLAPVEVDPGVSGDPISAATIKDSTSSTGCFYKDTDLIVEDLMEKTHRVRIGVADLDPKPVTTIVRHYLRDNEMLQAYTSYCGV